MNTRLWHAGLWCLLASTLAGRAEAADELPFSGDYGGAGLWQTPNARFGNDGAFGLGIVANSPYNRLFLNVVPVEGVEATFRYTDITNRLYSSDPTFSGDQSYKDRGVDVRIRLVKESDHLPAIALGLRDIGGTQLFGAQYLVASRRYYDLDFSLGLGWGRLSSGGPIGNPLKRSVDSSDETPGNFSFKTAFASPKIGVFGGVAWETPIDGLELSAEYDPNDYQNEPFDNPRHVKLPVNFGAKYRTDIGATAGVSYQRGSILSFQLGLSVDLGSPTGIPKVLDPRPPAPHVAPAAPVAASSAVPSAAPATDVHLQANTPVAVVSLAPEAALPAPAAAADPLTVALQVEKALKQQRIALDGFALSADGRDAQIWIAPGPYRDSVKLIGRTARAASSVLPESVVNIRITEVFAGVETYDAEVLRPALDQAAAGRISLDEFETALVVTCPAPNKLARQYSPAEYPKFGWSLNPALRSSVGGPDSFYFGQLYVKLGGSVQLTPGWSGDVLTSVNIYNNFDKLKLESNSQLPRVRSDIKNYLQEGEQALVRLETNYIQQLAPQWYGRLSGGIFEEMYGGVAGELLYRPSDPRWAVGLNVNRVRQRDFNQRFTFRDYEVTTGNLTGYFEFARPSVLVKLSVGQYLAGDRGATLDVSRQFPNGIRIGAFATKTNVSAAQFGEGSFDKGIYFSLPLDALLPRSSPGGGGILLRPLTRDGGQMVRDGRSLYDVTYGAVKSQMPLRDGLFFE